MELILALKINDEDATIAMRKAELAYNLSEVLPIINHRPFPAVNPDGPCENLCMRCRKRKFEYYFKWCMHVGVCAPCKETLLAADIARQGQGDNRRAACPMCQREHLGRDISRVYLV
ncbi:uncharacterized protein LOC132201415 [Neocloeon triangulifer]|uniref:uncharacterized protein LOC132201415 n=1 Tax=Neocloeon triangulifer TaxID=2078957 RepID=UPI00286FA4D3|nr:uncharacterized protein LOC132201415 [Neocloeon triangulifer]